MRILAVTICEDGEPTPGIVKDDWKPLFEYDLAADTVRRFSLNHRAIGRRYAVTHRTRGTSRARRSAPSRRRSCARSSSRSGDGGDSSGDPAPGEPADLDPDTRRTRRTLRWPRQRGGRS